MRSIFLYMRPSTLFELANAVRSSDTAIQKKYLQCKFAINSVQLITTNLIWTCLLIPLKYMENQEHSGQVQQNFFIENLLKKMSFATQF